jgi:hypothetical protein
MPPTPATTIRLTDRDRANLRAIQEGLGLRSLSAAIAYAAEFTCAREPRAQAAGTGPGKSKKSG